MKITRGIILVSIAAMAVFVTILWYGIAYIRGTLVIPSVVSRSDIVQTIVATGRVETPSIVKLGLPSSGAVSAVFVNEGDKVLAGDVLVTIDDSDAKAVAEQAEALVRQSEAKVAQVGGSGLVSATEALSQAKATVKNAQAKYDRLAKLADRGLVSDASLDDAKQALDIAASQVRAAEQIVAAASPLGSDLQIAQSVLEQSRASARAAATQFRNTKLLAPADGIIISRSAEVGMVVQAGLALVEFAPIKAKRLVLLIDERNLAMISLGLTALASPDAFPDQRFKATLSFINPIVDSDRGSFEVKLDVPEPPAILKEGMTVSVDIEVLRHTNAIVVDTGAIRDATGDKPHAYIIIDNRVVDRAVKVGATGNGKSEILSGLAVGDKVIPAALTTITVGQKVRFAPSTAAQ